MFKFYLPLSNPATLVGEVGGIISTFPLLGNLNELFAHVSGPPSGIDGVYQYRKLFITNDYAADSTYTRVWFDQIDHPEQISVALELSGSQTSTSPLVPPSGISSWSTPTNYVDGVQIGNLDQEQSTGIWIRQYLTGIVEEDPFATCRLYVGGIIA